MCVTLVSPARPAPTDACAPPTALSATPSSSTMPACALPDTPEASPAPVIALRWRGVEPYGASFDAMRAFTASRTDETGDEIWLVEHPPVFTLGQAGKAGHLLVADSGIPLVQVDRGGQITYHGPGQVVAYLLLDLRRRKLMVRELVALIEQAVIETLAAYNLASERKAGAPGIYVSPPGDEGGLTDVATEVITAVTTAAVTATAAAMATTAAPVAATAAAAGAATMAVTGTATAAETTAATAPAQPAMPVMSAMRATSASRAESVRTACAAHAGAKIAALGLKIRNGCSYHGVSLNVAMDLSPFLAINPCGYAGLETVDMATLGVAASWRDVAATLAASLVRNLDAAWARSRVARVLPVSG